MSEIAAEKTKKNFLYRLLCGVLLGISVIAPGISGSIMAVVMGVYDDLIEIISNPFKNFIKNAIYLFPMCLGAGASMIALLKILRLLFEHYPVPAYLLFISLIAGSIPTVAAQAKAGSIKPIYALGTAAAFAIALSVGLLSRHGIALEAVATGQGIAEELYYPISGAIAGITSMIPGMSVSMVLMMLGVYEPLLNAAADLDVLTVAPVAACFACGMVLFSRVTKYVFRKWRGLGYLLVLGFMCGSLISIFPGLPKTPIETVISILAILLGCAISYVLRKLAQKYNACENDPAASPQMKE